MTAYRIEAMTWKIMSAQRAASYPSGGYSPLRQMPEISGY
jgi:hypothetical protein